VKHLPLFFNVAGRKVVVVGKGPAADRRAGLAHSAGAEVVRADDADVADFADSAAAFVATGDALADAAAQRRARAHGVPVNVADRPALCDFILPAIVDRNQVLVAVSTGGASPTLAAAIRAKIESVLPEHIGRLAEFTRTFRAQANALIFGSGERRAFWRRMVSGPASRLALAGDTAGARRLAIRELHAARGRLKPVGIAHIVGAGPGDPDLLTLRAAQLLLEADAILYDELVPAAILSRARRDAEFLAVGKRKNHPGWSQSDIEAEMIRRVRAGQTVVRLKAGDPFIFGRGGEELDALRRAGLPVSVVPGITAALGVAASAGIALTHRRHASSVTFMTGRSSEDGCGGHTYVIYMGGTEAASVRDRLLDAGVAPCTPVAIVENGTRPDERISTGSLDMLARLAASHVSRGDAGPSLIVVGDVAAFAAPAAKPMLREAS